MAIEIVDFPIENGGSFHSFLYVYQRVSHFLSHHSPPLGASRHHGAVSGAALKAWAVNFPAPFQDVIGWWMGRGFPLIWASNPSGDGSKPIISIFGRINIHEPAILGTIRVPGFWLTTKCFLFCKLWSSGWTTSFWKAKKAGIFAALRW